MMHGMWGEKDSQGGFQFELVSNAWWQLRKSKSSRGVLLCWECCFVLFWGLMMSSVLDMFEDTLRVLL